MRPTRHKEFAQETASQNWSILGKLFSFAWPQLEGGDRRRIYASSACLALARLVSLAVPWLLGQLVGAAAGPLGDALALMLGLVLAYALARFVQTLLAELKEVLFVSVVQHAIRLLARGLFANLHVLPLAFHLDRQTGGLALAIERGTKAIEFMLSSVLFRFVPTFLELLAVCGIFWLLYGWQYALLMFGAIVAYAVLTVLVSNWRIAYRRRMNSANERAGTIAIDSLINHETVKIFSAEEREAARYDAALRGYAGAAVANQWTLSALNLGQALVITAGIAGILALASYGVDMRALDAGDLATLNAYLLQVFLPLGFLGTVYRIISQSLVDMQKAFDLLETRTSVADVPGAPPLQVDGGAVEFRGVGLTLGGRQVLEGVSFTLPARGRHALVGETGAGKTTVTRLLCRLLEPAAGQVLIDGQDVATVAQRSVRAAIAVVPQDIALFNDSIRVNLALGKADATEDEMMAALATAELAEFVTGLPEGLDTRVGERGLKLSGGERQRFAIARALLKDPRIMILDEATSALDVPTEKKVKAAMARATAGRTTLVIAHRLASVVDCDRIMVLADGRVAEAGTHAELLEKDGAYARAWAAQSRQAAAG
ncbi:MAG: ABC transporter ATP-binding protein/permease [Betaproteobacteria bacterium AqS2]|uniref:ABC transporter ATP-binding protein/permease n=1 Tax=Candidatus Amphirhobacter heronislandensis TaxID=1732024 RepID=A0A930XY94_9GAMM|nr:ABC transporter ATP-binding protein/permease [Betaproteobacteria bacterium AqS2]